MQFWHSGILTRDIDITIDFLCAAGGSTREQWTIEELYFPQSKMIRGNGGGLRAAFGRVGDEIIELLQPLDDSSYHAGVLKARGPGFHHNAYICGSKLDETVEILLSRGGTIIWEFQDDDEHALYIEADDGSAVLELINVCPIEV